MPGERGIYTYPKETGAPTTLLRLAKSALFRQRVINDVLRFFDSGELNIPKEFEGELPKFIRPRLIGIQKHLYAVVSVQRNNNPLLPFVKEANVHFSYRDKEEEIPPWKEIGCKNSFDAPTSSANFIFTSFLTAPENLVSLTEYLSAPGPERLIDKPSMEELMAEQRKKLFG